MHGSVMMKGIAFLQTTRCRAPVSEGPAPAL